MKKVFLLLFMFVLPFALSANDTEVVMHTPTNQGLYQVYVDPPQVTYDEELNELYVYFGTTGTIDLECDDGTGTPYYYIYGESNYGGYTATYTNLPVGYYTITIHSVYGYTYYGNFTVS